MVVEVMLHTLYLLVILMSFSSYEYHVALLRHHAGCAYCLTTVGDGYHLLHLLRIESGKHIVDDVLWFLEAW